MEPLTAEQPLSTAQVFHAARDAAEAARQAAERQASFRWKSSLPSVARDLELVAELAAIDAAVAAADAAANAAAPAALETATLETAAAVETADLAAEQVVDQVVSEMEYVSEVSYSEGESPPLSNGEAETRGARARNERDRLHAMRFVESGGAIRESDTPRVAEYEAPRPAASAPALPRVAEVASTKAAWRAEVSQ
ncbi:hypothetical protein M885DRAFT_500544 [Pelagophyceae sp. CCMP2097]|nr:hypothetical protein M885DRAFT_500544 [Pelagophyceae sp. CCMP2097]